jgi:hypothetical protein
MARDDDTTDLLDLHVSQVEEAPRRQRRTGWVLGGALAVVVVAAGVGIAAGMPHGSSAPTHAASSAASTSAAAPSTPAGVGTTASGETVVARAPLRYRAGYTAGLLTVGTGKLVEGLAPPVNNFHECSAAGTQVEFLPVEIREPVTGLAAAVTVQPGPTTPPGIGRLGFFFESGNGDAIPCRPGAAWPTTDTFEAVNGDRLITGYVVLDDAVTPATPQGRPDVFSSLQLKISDLRQFDNYVPQPLSVGTPTVGQLCSRDQDAVCAPLG